ncbi:putative low complexity [Cryptosporidium sp. chipmunk genotype I]|uniref:putative low complexity n=1 Tax=Cryptosporidium sp. chipmunk genotype I TaxID=1280935 RepID=UPI00351A1245|nr:putative low complexity [Cryptosporidium sp. chipmunk genotype I]
MMNVWSLKRLSSTTGSTITSSSNSIGYFAYSINSKIIIFDMNSMIDGNNGNFMLRSNTFNRFIIDIQGETKNIRPWKDFRPSRPQDYNAISEMFYKVGVKSAFVNDLQWGPYTQNRWSVLFSSLNNGIVHIWLVPNIDSYSLPNYSPTPCFELLDLLYSSIINETNIGLLEFDFDTMKAVKGEISQSFCLDLMLNTDSPIAHSCVLSVQRSEISLRCNGIILFSACWNEFLVVYAFEICESPKESCRDSISRILSKEQEDLSASFPIVPKVSCRPLILTKIPGKMVEEIVTSCLISEFWSLGKDLFFEIYTGSSEGKIHIFKFSMLEESGNIKCLGYNLIKKSYPSVPITKLCYKSVSKIGYGKEHMLLASEGTNVFLGKVNIESMSCEILKPNIRSPEVCHQMPIRTAKYMEDIIYKGEIFETAFLTVDQSGLGILHLLDLKNKSFSSFQVFTMEKLSNAPSVFPNLDQSSDNSNYDLESYNQNLNKSFSLESLQNVPSSIKSMKDSNNDFKLISFENPLVPGQFYSFKKKSLHNFSVAVINSAALNTIRLIIVFNNFSPMDHICNRILSHFIHTESLINIYSCLKDGKCLETLSRAISQTFTLNDIRLVLAGPLTMNKIPLLEEMDESLSESHEDPIQTKDSNIRNEDDNPAKNTDKKMSSFLNFKLGEKLSLKIENESTDENADDVMDVFLSIFYEIIPSELIKEAISYNLVDDEFPEDIIGFFQISKPVFSNLILLVLCYIIEIEPFIPKSLEYVVISCRDESSSFETLIKTLNQAVSYSGFHNKEIRNSNLSKESILSLLFKIMYLVRILNSLRCLVLLLYSRSNEVVDSLVIGREEQISRYLVKLQYYIQLQITQVYQIGSLEMQTDLVIPAGLKYIWSCVKEFNRINLSQISLSDKNMGEYFRDLINNSCCLVSEPPYNLYQCLNNHQELMDSETSKTNSSSSSSESNFRDDCVSSVPICPITFLPINVFALYKHLSCNFCGKVIFVPTEMIGQARMQGGKGLSSSISNFEKICLRGEYYSCQFCLNITELLDI